MSFTIFDIIMFTIIGLSSVLGLYRGFMRVTLGFSGFFISIIVAYWIAPYFKEFLSEYITQEILLSISSGFAAYIASLFMVGFINNAVYKILDPISLGSVVSSILGLIAGFIRGNIICIIIFVIAAITTTGGYDRAKSFEDIAEATTRDKYPSWLQNSLTLDYFDSLAHKSIALIPESVMKKEILPKEQKEPNAHDALEEMTRKRNDPDKNLPAPEDELGKHLNQILESEDPE